jgi:hypothetical protein
VERQAPAEHVSQSGKGTAVLGVQGATHPGRSSRVRNAVTPSASGPGAGRPTVRRAESLGGNRMTEKANAGSRKRTKCSRVRADRTASCYRIFTACLSRMR